MYKLWNMLAEMQSDAYEWVELSHSMNNDSPVWSGIPAGSVEVSKTVFDWGNPMLECLIQTFKFPGQYGTHIDFPGHFVKDMPLSEAFGAQQMLFPLCVIDITAKVAEDVHYAVTVEDIKAYEAEYGAIPDGAFVALRTEANLAKVNKVAEDAKTTADAAQTTANEAKTVAGEAKTTAEAAQAAAANNAKAIEANSKAIKANKTAIEQEITDRIESDNKLGEAINDNRTQIDANSSAIKDNRVAINQEIQDRFAADAELNNRINAEATTRANEDAKLDQKITDEATTRANEDKRIEAKFDGEVSRLDGRIDKLNDNVQKVGAMAAAIANLHTMGYDPEAPTEIAVGVGQYRDKTGMALGAFHYPNRDFMLSFSVSTAGDEYMGGIGATWKFGRKTPEELRQAEAEKAAKAKLAKAEAAKKAAKDARVAAQQKRHAEMLAARTAK